jgi:lipid-binding SYLF domain-containing protein
MIQSYKRIAAFALAAVASVGFLATPAQAQTEQQNLGNDATKTLSNFLRDPDMTWLQNNIGRAKGVLIAPEIVKAGFVFGGSGGRAVLIAHEAPTTKWGGPAFYTLAAASVGFRGRCLGVGKRHARHDREGLQLAANSVKLGGDASVAAGPVGAGAKSDVVARPGHLQPRQGVYGGLSLDGTVVAANDWNKAYYGKDVLPPDMLIRQSVHNKQGDALVAEVAKATKK